MALAVRLAALVLLCTGAAAEPMKWYPVTTTDPLAVCNDGSPAGYYHRPSSLPSQGKCVCLPQRWTSLRQPLNESVCPAAG